MTISVLAKARPSDIRRNPYPYLAIENALEPGLFRELEETFPSVTTITGGAPLVNAKKGLSAIEIVAREDIAPVWREFVGYHASAEFFREVVGLFGDDIRRIHPGLEKALGRQLDSLDTKLRVPRNRRAAHSSDNFVLDCQIMYDDTSHTRVCRGPHVDDPAELYACLLYFRQPDDTSEGGNLYTARARPEAEKSIFPRPGAIRVSSNPAEVDASQTDVVETIPYRPNQVGMFINSVRSLHAVTQRSASPVPRRHVNIIGESYALPTGLFEIEHGPGASSNVSALKRVQQGFSRVVGHVRNASRQGVRTP